MRQSLFILILGFIAGVSYTQHDGFKEWVDDSVEVGREWLSEVFDDAKDLAADSLTDAKENAKESFEENFEENFEELSTDLKDNADQIAKDTKEKVEE